MSRARLLGILAASIGVLSLAGCESSAPPRQADIIRDLPVTSFQAGLAEFEAVCFDGKADDPNDAFLFENRIEDGGQRLCSMRARAPATVDVFQTLQQRYGNARGGITWIFDGYPRGRLIYQPGFVNGAGEGTYQLGTLR